MIHRLNPTKADGSPAIIVPQRKPVWEPSKRQEIFLGSDDYEVLYGGAVGGGKSDALLIDGWCMQHNAHRNPNHSAIIFRRSYPELMELIDRSRELYPRFIKGVKYDQQQHRHITPHGAKLRFAYLANDQDRFKYKQAYNYIGFDELTLWPTSTSYLYLMTRNRTTDRTLPTYMRATTNPDGPGQKWVMERWGIDVEGGATRQEISVPEEVEDEDGGFKTVERKYRRTFIPAKLADNPHLRGTGYDSKLRMQDDPDVVDALLKGRWIGNRVKGAVFVNQMQKARQENRVIRVPHTPGYPVNTFWDIGVGDTTALWFHQQVGVENRFLRCIENSGVDFSYYVAEMQRFGTEFGYVYRKAYLPHDGGNRTPQTGLKNIEVLEKAAPGYKFEIVPRCKTKIISINQTRAAMATAVFDKEGCADGIAALDAYHFRFDPNLGSYSAEPQHDWSSNYADAFQGFGMGYEPVQSIADQATPEWKRNLLARAKGRARNPATA